MSKDNDDYLDAEMRQFMADARKRATRHLDQLVLDTWARGSWVTEAEKNEVLKVIDVRRGVAPKKEAEQPIKLPLPMPLEQLKVALQELAGAEEREEDTKEGLERAIERGDATAVVAYSEELGRARNSVLLWLESVKRIRAYMEDA